MSRLPWRSRRSSFHGIDTASQVRDLIQQLATDLPGERRQIRARILDDRLEAREIADPLGRDVAELVQVRPQRVDRFGALLHELLAGAEQDRSRLRSWDFGST
jgi:hypothetical protein